MNYGEYREHDAVALAALVACGEVRAEELLDLAIARRAEVEDRLNTTTVDDEAFARRTLEQTVACGGIGYSWWQFKDVRWGRFHSDFMGLLDMEGQEPVEGHAIGVEGTLKPAAEVFRTFDPGAVDAACEELPNYLNYSGHGHARITGRLVDEHGAPIEGGVVLAWNRFYSHSYHTTSRADGSFELLGDMDFHHWISSAVGHAMVRGECPASGFRRDTAGTATFHLGELELDQLRLRR